MYKVISQRQDSRIHNEQEYIAVGKFGASTSGVSQPLDIGKIFSSVKNSVRVQFLGCAEQRGHDTSREYIQSII